MTEKQEKQLGFDNMVEIEETTDIVETTQDEGVGQLSLYSSKPIFDASDIQPPVLKLLQALSPDVTEGSGKAGQWNLSGFSNADKLTVVPISFAKRREYRNDDTFQLECTSYDGEVGEGTPGGLCMGCPMNTWTKEGSRNVGPKCQFIYSYMVFVKEFDTVAVINFKRTALGVGRTLNSIVARTGMLNCAITLGSKLTQAKKGSYYVPTVTPVLDEVESSAAMAKAKSLLGYK